MIKAFANILFVMSDQCISLKFYADQKKKITDKGYVNLASQHVYR